MGFKVIKRQEEIETFLAEIEAVFIEAAALFQQALMTATPVVTGFHRNNWIMEVGKVSPLVRGSRANPPRAPGKIRTYDINRGSIFIHNSGPAIVQLDGGEPFTSKAPNGIVAPAVAAVKARYGAAFRGG